MSKEGLPTSIEEEPIKESEIACDVCGPSVQAAWDVVTNDDAVVYVCHKHHTRLLEKNLVFVERRIGEETWEEIEDYRALLNKVDMEKHEQRGKTN
jgi:hypothetical protein